VLVVGTAGHIDHGKTSLVRALTGVDLDRLPEEQERGITIALGFTRLDLPSGRVASFIDVPGHERLVRTMISGASGLDAVVLCVSAVEGVMPQTREHLDILELLGVQQGIVALTMTDLVDEEMLELAALDVEDAVEGTFLEGAPVIATAAGPAPSGLEALAAALDALQPPARASAGPLRLPIDRAFVQRGFGTVVTGTMRSGAVRDGDAVVVVPEGIQTRVRGLQVHGSPQDQSSAGLRTALNLAGVERDDLHRGMVVVHPDHPPLSSMLDCSLRLLPDAPPLAHLARVRLLVGTAEVMAVVAHISDDGPSPAPLEDPLPPGSTALVQLRTDRPVLAVPGDRCILRRESPVTTLGGAVVLDPWAPRYRRRHRDRAHAELLALRGGDRAPLLHRAGYRGLPAALCTQFGITGGQLLAGHRLGDQRIAALRDLLTASLAAWHRDHPLAPGAPRRDLHQRALPMLDARAFDALVQLLADQERVCLEGPLIRAPGFELRLTSAQDADYQAILGDLKAAGLQAPRFAEVLPRSPELVGLMLHREDAVRVGDKLVHASALAHMRSTVEGFLRVRGRMLPTDFKDLFGGLSRKHAIPLLEWLDSQKITVRDGDARILR
jgi:selenocysteine-specific elongation factor